MSNNIWHERCHIQFLLSLTTLRVVIIQGIKPTGGELWWDKENNRYAFNPSSKTGWQTFETRGCVILETKKHDLVALMPIGMAVVGSVNFEENVTPGTTAKKAICLVILHFEDQILL